MFGASIGRGASRIIGAMVRGLARRNINPNVLTVIGVSINVLSGLLFGFGHFFWAGAVLIVANLFDMLDGQVARRTNQVTRFGGFLDSTLDRVSDMAAFVGLMTFYARDTELHSTTNVLLAGLAMVGSVLVSYASARAESLIPKCDVGFLRRPERVVLLIIGALSTHPDSESLFANRMPAVLWILAVGSFWTFAYRVYHTWRELNRADAPAPSAAEAPTFQTVAAQAAAADAERTEPRGTSAPPERASKTDAERRDAPDITSRVPAPR
ncbi:MAG TPA: CDP-alcohol phosphatidyltransferase family protein [Pyrinomonadaceae bacterium]|nr:CDP-alcohol phosphatidyltransferase family protein [Pyrinomonadaceae bacterium]